MDRAINGIYLHYLSCFLYNDGELIKKIVRRVDFPVSRSSI